MHYNKKEEKKKKTEGRKGTGWAWKSHLNWLQGTGKPWSMEVAGVAYTVWYVSVNTKMDAMGESSLTCLTIKAIWVASCSTGVWRRCCPQCEWGNTYQAVTLCPNMAWGSELVQVAKWWKDCKVSAKLLYNKIFACTFATIPAQTLQKCYIFASWLVGQSGGKGHAHRLS